MKKNETTYDQMKRKEIPATGVEGITGGKTNDPEASLRKGKLPASSAVTTVPYLPANAGLAKKIASGNPENNPKKTMASLAG